MMAVSASRRWNGADDRGGRALRSQVNVISALFFREAESRNGRRFALGYLAAAIEPLMIVSVLCVVLSVIGRAPPYGRNLVLFIGTGVFPVYLFIHTSMRMRQPLALGRSRTRYPVERPLDHVLVHALLHFLSSAIVAFLFFGALYAWGVSAAFPQDPMLAIEALTSVYLLGVALGIINSVLGRIVHFWDVIWPALARSQLHFAGIYFVVAYLPLGVRWIFALNPLTHAVNWFRHAFYPFYPDLVTNPDYVLFTSLILLTLGLLLEVGTRRYLEERE